MGHGHCVRAPTNAQTCPGHSVPGRSARRLLPVVSLLPLSNPGHSRGELSQFEQVVEDELREGLVAQDDQHRENQGTP